jgi:hypothetical protein
MVAAHAHQNGSRTSASRPSSMKTVQNIFFCMGAILRELRERGERNSSAHLVYQLNPDHSNQAKA